MKIKYLQNVLIFLTVSTIFGQNKMAYQIFDKNGKLSNYKNVLKKAAKSEVVLFGELHDNSIIHWLQLKFTKDLSEKNDLILGAEMFESDNQNQLNQYLRGEINARILDSAARLWPNFKTDYKPLLDFAKDKKLNFIATNVPRRYASMVYKKDFPELEHLSEQEKLWIAPLPIAFDLNLPGYKSMLTMQGGHAGDKMPKAQAIKDATMAHFIIKNLKAETIFIHYNGTYHSENYEGINWYLKKQNPNLVIVTIATVEQKDISKLEKEHYNKANFIIVVDQDVTKTY